MYFFTQISIGMDRIKTIRKHIKLKLPGNLILNQWTAKHTLITF